MKILAIETSCDETSIALVEARGGMKGALPKFKVLENLVSSQIPVHRPYGGVVPNLAKREHIRNLPVLFGKISGISNFQFPISNESLNSKFKKFLKSIDLIAVTVGPGLEPALWTGIEFAKQLYLEAKDHNPKLILRGANHMEGHLYSFLLAHKQKAGISNFKFLISKKSIVFPAVALVVSGGHTMLLLLKDITHWRKLGETRDDAAGEAFDKVGRILGLPYPGGPEIEKAARKGNPHAIAFPRPMLHHKGYDFSFSGLKTSVLYYIKDSTDRRGKGSVNVSDVAASFQQAAIDVLVFKTMRAAEAYGVKSVILCGGVAANTLLRETLAKTSQEHGVKFFAPEAEYNGDNAAMIAAAAYIRTTARKRAFPVVAEGNLGM